MNKIILASIIPISSYGYICDEYVILSSARFAGSREVRLKLKLATLGETL